jgi:hypothetical protein
MNGKEYGRKGPWCNFRCYPGIYLKKLKKTRTNFSNDSSCPGRDANRTLPEHRSEAFPNSQRAWLGLRQRKVGIDSSVL